MGTNVYSYVYDSIGNRKTTDHGQQTTTYLANELNQYLSVTSVSSVVNLSYDPDGNLTNDGTFAYTWDAENRLSAVYSNETVVLQNAYDYMSRRVSKTTPTTTSEFIYDGWNLIRETQVSGLTSQVSSFVWGLDLSGTLQGAGGIGGLLSILNSGSCLLTPVFDANGNVTDMVDTNGSVVAHYEYDPYGNEISRQGAEAQSNPYRFSTKYTDDETGLLYYGFRFYSAELGRWISRDPLGEIHLGRSDWVKTLVPLYCFNANEPISKTDLLGLAINIVYRCQQHCVRWSAPMWQNGGYSSLWDCANALTGSSLGPWGPTIGVGIGIIGLYPPIGIGSAIGGTSVYIFAIQSCSLRYCLQWSW